MVAKTGQGATSISKNQEQAMQRTIVPRVTKTPFRSGLYSVLAVVLSIPVSGWAVGPGWTQDWCKVYATQASGSGFYVWVDPQACNNVNNCPYHLGPTGYVEQSAAVFWIVYPTTNTPSEAQKVMISQLSLAASTGQLVRLH
jgi:hypothetical protein